MSLRSTAWVAAALLSTLFLFGGAHFQQEDATSSGRPVTARVEASAAQHHTRYLPLMMRPLPPTGPRGYLTTPQELAAIREKAARGIEPYRSAMAEVLEWANSEWDYALDAHENCSGSDDPKWLDNEEGGATLYAKALAYHLTGESRYAAEVKTILEQIMTRVETISVEEQQCRLNFGWGTPELVAAADLIDSYWSNLTCTGPTSTRYGITAMGSGKCKFLFQNWLAKNPYYVVSYSAESSGNNWGAAATNAIAYIADYLWDRPSLRLIHRSITADGDVKEITLTPAQAYARANRLALDRMNGYRVSYGGSSCDRMNGPQQSSRWAPVKSQITENGIIPEDARRDEYCNIPRYNGSYQNYPQIHLGNNIQQCELMWRRGDSSCYDNVDMSDLPEYTFTGPDGETKKTHLKPGRGSIERAINAIIVDSGTPWEHDSALRVAYRYYYHHHRLGGIEQWAGQLDRVKGCSQDICFGTLTHGFAPGEEPGPPPVTAAIAGE